MRLLKKYFGYDAFRPGQAALIQALAVEGKDVMGIMPTGAGKSLCYQIPALMLEGITIVVSPLISLMQDQVAALRQAGIRAAYFNSSLSWPQYKKALTLARQGTYKIIYVAPERLLTDLFLDFAKSAPISLVAVDEAHCVSQWGQNFRPKYLEIAKFMEQLPVRPKYCAFTATATAAVQKDMIRLLGLRRPARLVTGFDRPNLFYEVQRPRDKKQALLKFLRARKDECGIVYCQTRKECEEINVLLQSEGFLSAVYHAGLSDEERSKAQEDFLYDRSLVIVATNAFGMGIDKSNVRYVVHYSLPHSVENYYQEAGRAGRDGEDSHCLLLYSPNDVRIARFIIENSISEDNPDSQQNREELIQRDLVRLKRMVDYALCRSCLRGYILRYFGQKAEASCHSCSSCCRKWEEKDVTEAASHVLQLLNSLPCSYGMKMTTDLLKGASTEKIRSAGLARTAGYGSLKDWPRTEVENLLEGLADYGWLEKTGDQYPVIQAAECFYEAAEEKKPILIRAEQEKEGRAVQTQTSLDQDLFDHLRKVRMGLARSAGIPPYIIFNDKTLRQLARIKPKTKEEMLQVQGIGQAKFSTYGPVFLEAIETFEKK